MQTIEIEDGLAVKISKLAESENKSLTEFVDSSLREILDAKKRRTKDEEKLKRFADSYRKHPQKTEEYEIWQSEQVWENQ